MAKSPESPKADPLEAVKRIMGRLVNTPPKPHAKGKDTALKDRKGKERK